MSSQPHPTVPAGSTSDRRRDDARLHVRRRRAFSLHARVYAASMVVVVAVNAAINATAHLTGEWWAWWSVPALLGWGLGVAVHGLVVRLARPQSVALAREQREIEEFLAAGETESLR